MSNNKSAKSAKSASKSDKSDALKIEADAAAIDAALQTVVETAVIAAANLTAAVKDAVEKYRKLKLDDDAICDRIKAVYARAQKSNSVNKALRAAGLRQRALRSDAGKARDAVSILDALMGAAKGKAKGKAKADETDAVERLARRAWAFADEDADEAIAILKSAIEMIEAGDMDDTDESADDESAE